MSEVKRYRIPTLPGRVTRDSVEVVEASEWDALSAQLAEARAELAKMRDARARMAKIAAAESMENDALRAAIEKHNNAVLAGVVGHCGACGELNEYPSSHLLLRIPLPAAAQPRPEYLDVCGECGGPKMPGAQGSARTIYVAPTATVNGSITCSERSAGAEPMP